MSLFTKRTNELIEIFFGIHSWRTKPLDRSSSVLVNLDLPPFSGHRHDHRDSIDRKASDFEMKVKLSQRLNKVKELTICR